ncbi:hypothetical protein V6N13_076199 [Hibiscus sabdariffa]|uniref:Uncharacterized protein n=1 Tax=Hibiscus sabdariffa TaxID=183260 RepID=A0ABR2CT74_9ROSI
MGDSAGNTSVASHPDFTGIFSLAPQGLDDVGPSHDPEAMKPVHHETTSSPAQEEVPEEVSATSATPTCMTTVGAADLQHEDLQHEVSREEFNTTICCVCDIL